MKWYKEKKLGRGEHGGRTVIRLGGWGGEEELGDFYREQHDIIYTRRGHSSSSTPHFVGVTHKLYYSAHSAYI